MNYTTFGWTFMEIYWRNAFLKEFSYNNKKYKYHVQKAITFSWEHLLKYKTVQAKPKMAFTIKIFLVAIIATIYTVNNVSAVSKFC